MEQAEEDEGNARGQGTGDREEVGGQEDGRKDGVLVRGCGNCMGRRSRGVKNSGQGQEERSEGDAVVMTRGRDEDKGTELRESQSGKLCGAMMGRCSRPIALQQGQKMDRGALYRRHKALKE